MPARLFFLTAVVTWTAAVNAFLGHQPLDRKILRTSDALKSDAKFDPYEDSCGGDALDRNRARTDLRNFLTQRSIQSFVYLLNQCHDGHTVGWLEVRKRDFIESWFSLDTTFSDIFFLVYALVSYSTNVIVIGPIENP